jgi:(p)ppGpp synthase/HD superfamily hydrolase
MSHRFAQTNIQLLNQMHRDGYERQDLSLVLRSYDLAKRLLTGRYRGSGKTFIAHLVGTASILAVLRVPATLVAAGLIHAVYENGDFGDGARGISDARRDLVRTVVGEDVEDYVVRYTSLAWSDQMMQKMQDEIDTLPSVSRDVLLMRLANELEDYLDLGILYCGIAKRRTADYANEKGRIIVNMANKLGFAELAQAMAAAFEEAAKAKIPPVSPLAQQDFSYLIAPLSYQRLMEAVHNRLAKIDAEGKTIPRPQAAANGEEQK